MADAVEDRLVALGEALEFTRLDTLADDVLADLHEPRSGVRWRRPLLVAAALLLVVGTVVVAVPGSRRSVARWLGFDDLRIERVETVPPTLSLPQENEPAGTLAAAYARVGAAPLVAPALGAPVSIETPLDRYVIVRYADASFVVLPGRLEAGAFTKSVGATAEVRPIELFGGAAYWIAGDPHVFSYVGGDGVTREARAAADTLVWQRGDDIVRVEGDVTLERAIEIARSVRAP